MWDETVARLDPPRRTIAVDLLGAGTAPLPHWPPTLSDHADGLERVLEELHCDRVVLVGCAVGSMVACALAERLGLRVSALVLANPILRITPQAGEVLLERARKLHGGKIAAIEEEVLDRAFSGVSDATRKERFRNQFREQPAVGYAELARGLVGADVAHSAAALAAPALLVPGRRDAVLPDWHQTELQALMRNVRCRPVEAGHFAPQQAPTQFASVLSTFLAAIL